MFNFVVKTRSTLIGSAGLSAIAAAALCASPAFAQSDTGAQSDSSAQQSDAGQQQTADQSTTNQANDIVVTGYAASLERALDNKRNADVVSDGISAEDIGKYPDPKSAVSLQRVTGVQITRSLGDGQYLSVRGLDPKFTDTLYNGRQLPTASGTRQFDFQVLTANFANRVDVYKSPTPDMIESGLAATVNMQSTEPLTVGNRFSLAGEGNYDEQLNKGIDPHFSALFSHSFFDGKLGISIAGDYSNRRIDDQQMTTDGVVADSTYTGPGTQYRIFGLHENDNVGTDKHRSVAATIQYKPTDNFELKLDTIYSHFGQQYNMYQGNNWYTGAGALGASPTTSETVDGNGVETAWSGSNVFQWVQANQYDFEQDMNSTALSAHWNPGRWKIDAEVSYGHAVERTTQTYVSWATAGGQGASLAYDTTTDPGGPIGLSFTNGYDPTDPSHYYFFGVQGSYKEPTTDDIWNGKIDAARDLGGGFLRTLKVGVNVEDRVLATTPNYITNTANGLPSDMSSYLEVYNNPNFFSTYGGPAQFPRSFLSVNLNKFFDDFSLANFVAANPPAQQLTETTRVEERSQAGYVRLDFANGDNRLSGNVGVRLVHTQEASSGYVPTPDATLVYGLFGGGNSLSYTDAALQAQTHDYTYVLPSLNARYQVSNNFLVRIALARVMQRPDMNLLAAASSPNAPANPPPGGTWLGTLAEGNPNLKPYLSDQADLSLEYYFGKRNVLAAAFFVKDVKNLVLTSYYDENAEVTLAGQNTTQEITLSVSQPVNASSTTIKGIEAAYQQAFDFLPGPLKHLGFQANWTHIWYGNVLLNENSPAVPLTGISKDTFNLGGYYDDGHFSLNVGYNYRSRWVQDPIGNFGDGTYTEGYGQLDLAANYQITKHISVNAWAINLTQSALRQTDRYGILKLYELSGRRFTLGIRANF
jgi:iron complex outermembrane recepter protein